MNDDTTNDTTSGDTARARAASTLAGHLGPYGDVDFRGLEADLGWLGQAASVRAALHAAEAVCSRWTDEPRAAQAALDAARAWLAAPSDRTRREAHRASSRLKPLLRALERRAYVDVSDGLGGDEEFDDEDADLFDDGDFDGGLLDLDAALAFHAGTAVFASARAAHARTAASAAAHAGGALAAAYRVLDLEGDDGDDLVIPLVDHTCTSCGGGHSHADEHGARALGVLTDALAAALSSA